MGSTAITYLYIRRRIKALADSLGAAFAQATPCVLALKFVLDVEPIKPMPALAFEVRRVAAGIPATHNTESGG